MEGIAAAAGFSLLYPPGVEHGPARSDWSEAAIADLGIDSAAASLSIHPRYRDRNRAILLELPEDTGLIAYRQEILQDFLDCASIRTGLEELFPHLEKLRDTVASQSEGTAMRQTLGRLAELGLYIACIRRLRESLERAGSNLQSAGLRGLRGLLAEVENDETHRSLAQKLPELQSRLNNIPSVTIGINLDSELLPVEATLLSINEKPFRSCTLMDWLTGKKSSGKPDRGIGPLHSLPSEHVKGIDMRVVRLPSHVDPLMVPLFKDLYEVLRAVLKPITSSLKEFAQVNTGLLLSLESELAFYMGAAALIDRLRARGLPTCRPGILPAEERIAHLQGLYNLLLALNLADEQPDADLGGRVVLNDADFGPQGRIFILTGPNQGGKTVYTQAVGLAQILFQAGLHVPAGEARMSPADGVYTHFATLEEASDGMGRLGEESRRLNEIFQRATPRTLVLLNESLSSTSPGESLYLARDIVRALRLFGVRAIFATHLHELAEGLDAVNAEVQGDSLAVSLVAGILPGGEEAEATGELAARTYRIEPGPPRGLSYAKGIAARYGISFEQLAERWRGQGEVARS
jgi:DNA mismatch repair ATPase MutS